MINSRTLLFGVIGDPIEHSLSPILQNFMIRQFGLDAAYLAFHVSPDQLPAAIAGARALGAGGLNVTIPHKAAAAALSHWRAPEVEFLGVANTLHFSAGQIKAYNTDGAGFFQSLGSNRSRFQGSRVVLFGAGGAASAICLALAALGTSRLTIVNRSREKATKLAEFCQRFLHVPDVEWLDDQDPGIYTEVADATIVINTTSLGMAPNTVAAPLRRFDMLGNRHFVYDLIYNPRQTRLLEQAEKQGAAVQDGLDMLIFQGLAALNIWHQADYQLDDPALAQLRTLLLRQLS